MGMTITEKILARAGGTAKVSPGDVAVVDVETACLLDLSFLPEGWREVLKVADPSKVVIVFDHLAPAPTVQAAENMRVGPRLRQTFRDRAAARCRADQGISHAVIADRAYALPGTVLVNGDSHTCAAGAFNCAARGVGGPDMLYAVTTGKAWFRVGETIRYDFTGRLRPGVSAKDIFLHHRRDVGGARQPEHRVWRAGMSTHQRECAAHAGDDGHRAVGGVRHLRAG